MLDPLIVMAQLAARDKEIGRLSAELKLANDAFNESDAACADLEDAMRAIQAATSDKVVLAITDKALCGGIVSETPPNKRRIEHDPD